MRISEAMNRAVTEWVKETEKQEDVVIVKFEEETVYGGYCETCSYEEIRVKVTWKIPSWGSGQETWYHGDMGEFIRTLDSYDV